PRPWLEKSLSGSAPSIFSPIDRADRCGQLSQLQLVCAARGLRRAPSRSRLAFFYTNPPAETLHGVNRRVLAEYLAHRVRDLSKRAPAAHCIDYRRHQIFPVARRRLDPRQRLVRRLRVSFRPHARNACLLLLLEFRLHPQQFPRRFAAPDKLVDPYDNSLPGFNLALVNESRVLNFALHVAALDCG